MQTVQIVEGDITTAEVDAIVNAANPQMLGGGGVDGAIHRAAGPELLEACQGIKSENGIRCPVGSARLTSAGKLKAKYVIHAVGPIYNQVKNPEALLKQTYLSVMQLAEVNSCTSLAIPAISCGVYGFPVVAASRVAVSVCSGYPAISVKFYLVDRAAIEAWQSALRQ